MTLEQEIELKNSVYEKTGYIPKEIRLKEIYKNLNLLNSKYFQLDLNYEKINVLSKMYILCLKVMTTNLEFLNTKVYVKDTNTNYLLNRQKIIRNIKNNINIKTLTVDDDVRLDINLFNLMKNIEFNAERLDFKFFDYMKLAIEEIR